MTQSPTFYWQYLERLLLLVWVGCLWAIGFLAAPVLFNQLSDRALAGTIAGSMFEIVSYIGLFCGAALWLGSWYPGNLRFGFRVRRRVVLAMLLLVALGQFVLQPVLSELRAGGLVEGSVEAVRFARLHGLSAFIYIVVSLLGLVLVILLPPSDER